MKQENWKKQKNAGILIYLFAAALLPLLISSKCSPLYPFNDWPDLNVFFTIGKGMVHGKVMYAELMDHKGPYVYAMSALAYLVSHDTFFGVFLQEIINMFIFLFLAWKTIGLYVKNRDAFIWLLPLLSAGIAGSKSFVHGGSMEEFCIGIYAYGIYSLLRFLRDESERPMKIKTLMINGILAGILFWAKFTVLGFYIAWMAIVMSFYLFRKQYRQMLKSTAAFLAAFLAPTIPWLIYFGYHHQIGTWLEVYLWNNIFGYSTTGKTGLWERLYSALLTGFRSVKDPDNLCYGLLLMVGCVVFVCLPDHMVSLWEKGSVALLGIAAVLGIFIGGTLQDYYSMPLAAFSTFGLLVAALALEQCEIKLGWKNHGKRITTILLGGLVLLLGSLTDYRISSNAYLLEYKKEEMPQYRFAEIIEKSEDTTLLNYGFLDGGFYTVLDQVPLVQYFCTMNINSSYVFAQQNTYVEQELTNWVVTWKGYDAPEEELRNIPILSEHYELIDYVYFPLEEAYRTYALYQRKE